MDKILLADDESDIVALISFRLQASGYEVIIANDGMSCVEKAKDHKPRVILLDLVMPVMDGYEACRRLKEMPETRDIPIILFTASYTSDIEEKAKVLGAFDYIVKPFEPGELMGKILKALGKWPGG